MSDWLGELIHALRLASDLVEEQAKCEHKYDAGYFLARDYEELQEAKTRVIELLAKEIQSYATRRRDA